MLFRFLSFGLRSKVLASSASKTASVAAEHRALLVFPVPAETVHLKPVCGTICKCELYCLSKRSPHFINQWIITFDTFWDLIFLHRKNALKYILLYFSKLEFQRVRYTFPVCLQQVFILFGWDLARMLPNNVAKKPCRGIFIFGLLRK